MSDKFKSSRTLLAFSLALVILDLQPSFLSTAEFVKSIQNALKLKNSVLQRTISFPGPQAESYVALSKRPCTIPDCQYLHKASLDPPTTTTTTTTIGITSLLPQLNQFLSLTSSLSASISNPALNETIRSILLYLLQELSNSIDVFSSSTSLTGLKENEKKERETETILVRDRLTRLVGEIGMDDLLGLDLEVQILGVLERIWEREEREV